MGSKTSPLNIGVVVSVRGSVVDMRFNEHLPSIYSLLHAQEGEIAIEVLTQLDAHHVGGIALTPTQMPSRLDYQTTMGTELSGLEERIANTDSGAITSIQEVYVPADDFTDPADVRANRCAAGPDSGTFRPDTA